MALNGIASDLLDEYFKVNYGVTAKVKPPFIDEKEKKLSHTERLPQNDAYSSRETLSSPAALEIEKGFLAASDEPRPSVLEYLENIAQTALLEAAEDGDCERLVSIMEGRSSQGYQGYGPGHGMESLPSRHTSNGSNASSGTKNRNQNPNLDAVELAISINAASSSSSSNSSSCKLSDTSGHSSAGGERGSDARKSERRMGGGKVSGTSGEAGLDLNEVELVRDSDWKNARVRGSMERAMAKAMSVKEKRYRTSSVSSLSLSDPTDTIIGKTPLIAASKWGHLDVVRTLVESGWSGSISRYDRQHSQQRDGRSSSHRRNYNPHRPNESPGRQGRGGGGRGGRSRNQNHGRNRSHSHKQSSSRSIDTIRDVDINAITRDGWSALIWASWGEHEEVVEFLLEARADPDVQNFDGDTALHWACRRNSLEIAELLIEKGKCSLHLTNSYSENPCNIAQDAGHSEVLRYLQSRGGEVGEGRKKRVFQMQYASPMEAARDGAERQLEAMFHMSHGQGKQDICNTTDENGNTALIMASKHGHMSCAKLLTGKRAEVNQANNDGWSALICAARQGHIAIVRHLLDCGAEINHCTHAKDSALMWAVYKHDLPLVLLLADNIYCDINMQNEWGYSPVMWAAKERFLEGVKALVQRGAKLDLQTPLKQTIWDLNCTLQVAAAIEMGLQFPVIIVRKKRVQTGTAAKNSQGKEKEIQGKEAHNINSSSANPNAAAEHTSHNTSTANIRHSSLSVDDVMDAHTRQSRRGSRGSVYSRNSRRSSAATINSRRNSVEKGSVN